ncbi:MAG: bi-domain-containing oxidoreductase [Myxococcales bacterium]|nr:bi-domain-containing oxidoreductase [Myxococcales bacterium]
MDLAKKSLWGKAKARPDLVRKLMAKASRDGLIATVEAARRKLDSPIPLGYSCSGIVLAVGEGVEAIPVGARVACAGAKVANHAEMNLVPQNLCALIPAEATDEAGAFVTVGAIALQGVRQAQPTLGETFAVIGLGLIGQLAVQLLRANGCRVLGVDLDPRKVALAERLGAERAMTRNQDVLGAAAAMTGGRGVDGVVITAATSSNDPIQLAGDLCRDRGRVVAVGAVGMDVPRRPYYDKEIALYQSRSYGPGRYDPVYEELGMDYPIGYVRWTEKRNMEAFLQLAAEGRIDVEPLISHRFLIGDAESAYELIGPGRPADVPEPLGILLTYPIEEQEFGRTIEMPAANVRRRGNVRIGFAGAGNFASGVLIPALAETPHVSLSAIASARGFTATHLAEHYGFSFATTDLEALLGENTDAVVISTRHNLHAAQATAALKAGKHVFVEKPLALDEDELGDVLAAQKETGKLLMVGFNRRFSPLAVQMQQSFLGHRGPLVMHYRVNAGTLPADSWIYDPAVGGGRIVGEACHFIDLMSFIAGASVVEVYAKAVAPKAGVRADENVILTITYADGSIGSIHYVATGDTATGKERLEVIGEGACAYLEDFRFLDLHRNGKSKYVRKLSQDKGHKAELAAFVEAVRQGGPAPIPIESLSATTRATFAAMRSLATGLSVSVAI